MTSFGHRVFADEIKLRCGHTGLEWALNPITGVLIRRPYGSIATLRHTYRTQCENGSRDWSDISTSQGTQRIAGNHQQLGRGKEGSSAPVCMALLTL